MNLDFIFRYGRSARSALTTAAIRKRSRLHILFLLDCSATLPSGSSPARLCASFFALSLFCASIIYQYVGYSDWLRCMLTVSIRSNLLCFYRCFLNIRLPWSCFDDFFILRSMSGAVFAFYSAICDLPIFAGRLSTALVSVYSLVRSSYSRVKTRYRICFGRYALRSVWRIIRCRSATAAYFLSPKRMPSVLVIVRIIVRNALLSVSVLSKTLRRNTHTIKMCLLNREFLFGLYAH